MSISKAMSHGRSPFSFVFLAVFMATMVLQACADNKKAAVPAVKPAVPVEAALVSQRTVPLKLMAIGNVEALATVGIKAQVGGELMRVLFKEGQEVKKGDLLFNLDPRPYEAALKQAEAMLAKDTAQVENAREEARRYGALAKNGYVAQEQYDQARTTAAALEATVNADRANVDSARLQLQYCAIYAPITGRTGDLLSHQGNLIKANADTAMVVIKQIQPIVVSFTVPEQHLAAVKGYMADGKLKVEARVAEDGVPVEEGELSFIDNTVDMATGTIKLKGLFANAAKRLWPGQFVRVALTVATQPDAVLAPTRAIQAGQNGSYVFVIKDDLSVESRAIETSGVIEQETIVAKGLQPGEKVVTDGHLRLVPGATVVIQNSDAGGKP